MHCFRRAPLRVAEELRPELLYLPPEAVRHVPLVQGISHGAPRILGLRPQGDHLVLGYHIAQGYEAFRAELLDQYSGYWARCPPVTGAMALKG